MTSPRTAERCTSRSRTQRYRGGHGDGTKADQLPNPTANAGIDGIAVDSATRRLLVPDSPTGQLFAVHLSGSAAPMLLSSGLRRPVASATDPFGNVFVASESSPGLTVVSPAGAKRTLGAFSNLDEVVWYAGLLYITELDHGDVLAVDPSTGASGRCGGGTARPTRADGAPGRDSGDRRRDHEHSVLDACMRGAGVRARIACLVALLGMTVLSGCAPAAVPQNPASPVATSTPAPTPSATPGPPGFLLPGQAAALPAMPAGVPFRGHLLIAESSSHSRILEIDPAGKVTWTFSTTSPPLARPLGPPDDAFYTLDGRSILLNSEDGQGGLAVNRGTAAALWQIGTYRVRGKDSTHFNNPDDLVPAADGSAWMADIRNCRLLHVNGSTGMVMSTLGGIGCGHNPPARFSMPNGAFPVNDGSLVVTEIGGAWVDWINPDGTLRWSHHVPATYPSDGIAYPDGSVLLTDYSTAGQVLRIAPDGTVLWRYAPHGTAQLNHPSIAIPLASNRIAVCDDYGNRIVIVDPTTSRIVWQWSGTGAYQLARPDGLDYRPS